MQKDSLIWGDGESLMGKTINIRPTTGVYATYRRLSYEPWTAIAEFVDNSTQSFYDHKDKLFETKYYKKLIVDIEYIKDNAGDMIVIKDNAFGMEMDDFERAVVLDRPPKNTRGRNEFGMGLKTAACWFGSWWSVESTQLGSTRRYRAVMDVDSLEKYKNEEIEVEEETVSYKEHYTIITIKRINKPITGARTKGAIKALLSSMYRADIRTGLIEIRYNGDILEFKEPPVYIEHLCDGNTKEWKQNIDFDIEHNGEVLNVNGFIAIRLPGSIKDAGFTLLRRGRVVVGGPDKNYRPNELFGDSNSFPYQRLYGELNLDNWRVTQAKDNFDWHNSGLEEKFIESLLKYTKTYRQKAEEIRQREIIKTSDLPDKIKSDLQIPGFIDNVNVEILKGELEQEPVNDNISTDVPSNIETPILEGGAKLGIQLTHKNKQYSFVINLDMYSPLSQWLAVEEKDHLTFELTINMTHRFFKPLCNDKSFIVVMTKFVLSMVLAEIEARKATAGGTIDSADIRLNMNEILAAVASNEVKDL